MNNLKRIQLLITNDSLPLGGAETLLLQHLQQIDRTVFEVHMITQTDKGELLSQARNRADHYACLNRRSGLDVASILRLRRYIVQHQIELVHTQQWLDSLYVFLATIGLSVRKITTIHGYDYTWRQFVHLHVLKYFDRVICVSQSLKLDMYKLGIPWNKLKVVYNCYDADRFNPILNSKSRAQNGTLMLIMVGNFHWWKDQMTLIEAVNILKSRGYDIALHLAGEGELMEACQKRAKELDIDRIVKFWGKLQVDASFLSKFDLFVFSSLCETFGIALLEAMACGLPVLASNIPPLMELIRHGDCGTYFEARNSQSCADGILKFIKRPSLLNSIGQKAHARAQDFHPEKIIIDLERTYLYVR